MTADEASNLANIDFIRQMAELKKTEGSAFLLFKDEIVETPHSFLFRRDLVPLKHISGWAFNASKGIPLHLKISLFSVVYR